MIRPSNEQTWQNAISALENFTRREGHCRVPRHFIEGTYRLGQWVAVQRYLKDKIAVERKAQLNELGFVWSRRDWLWERGFAALKAFAAREGHCRVHAQHIEGTLKLGYWISVQRRNRNKMSEERKRRLNAIGFVWQPRKPNKATSKLHRHDAPIFVQVAEPEGASFAL